MNGQWLGTFAGSNTGAIRLNLDNKGDHYAGVAFLLDANPELPDLVVAIRTADKSSTFATKTLALLPVDPRTGSGGTWDDVKAIYPSALPAAEAEVHGEWKRDTLELKWTTNIGTTGNATLERTRADTPTDYVAQNKTWNEFKDFVVGLPRQRYLFRGQSQPWRLRTHFHRTGRADLG